MALQPSDSKARESHCRALFACGEYLRVINEYKSLGGNGKANTQLVGDLVLRAQVGNWTRNTWVVMSPSILLIVTHFEGGDAELHSYIID